MSAPRFSSLLCRLFLPTALALLIGHPLRAQLPIPAGTDLFGDDIAVKIPTNPGLSTEEEEKAASAKAEGYRQTLIFQNDCQLRGEIVSIGKEEILWRRPDASAPIRFARNDVRRMVFAPDVPLRAAPAQTSASTSPPPVPVRATVKLAGADWLYGDLTSADGRTFTLKTDATTSFTIERSSIEWLYYGSDPEPAVAFSGEPSDLAPFWPADRALHMEGKTAVLDDGALFGDLPPTKRLEIVWEIPADGAENTRLMLYPSITKHGIGSGDLHLEIGASELVIADYTGRRSSTSATLPESVRGGHAPERYRILYDDLGNRLVVFCNGQQVIDLKPRNEDDKDSKSNPTRGDYAIQGFSIQRSSKAGFLPVKLDRLRIAPWDGVISEEGEKTSETDRLSSDAGPGSNGNLQAVSAASLEFSGVDRPLQQGMFVKFPSAAAATDGPNCRVLLQNPGRLTVSDLHLDDGRAHWRSTVTPLDMPIEALQSIISPQLPLPAPSDVLVFRDGDELAGSLVSATPGGALRWRTSLGQDLDFPTERIASVRFAPGERANPVPPPAVLELRNGDRLRAELTTIDEKSFSIKHPQFGTVYLSREQVRQLYPSPRFVEFSGTRTEETLLGVDFDKRSEKLQSAAFVSPLILANGAFLGRNGASSIDLHNSAGSSLEAGLDRYQISFDVTNTEGGSPGFFLYLRQSENGYWGGVCFDERGLQFYSKKTPHMTKRQFDAKDITCRCNVRAFVNPKVGIADVFIDGVHAVNIGGGKATERIPGIGGYVDLHPELSMVVSNLWIGPWSGEFPSVEAKSQILLGNGDFARGSITVARDGKFSIESESGPIEVAFENVQSIDFGGEPAPQRAAARVRLPDGSSLNLERFRFEDRQLTGHSQTLGDLRLAANALYELILDPAIPHPPHAIVAAPTEPNETPQTNPPGIR